MIQKKICVLGSCGVGKTSLIGRFVHSVFSESYPSTIDLKVDRKQLVLDGSKVNLLLWDLHGDDAFQRVRANYLHGMSGYLLVMDRSRADSVRVAVELHQLAKQTVGDVPFLALVNKRDLAADQAFDESVLSDLARRGWIVHQTSAKAGWLVNESFELLARLMLAADQTRIAGEG